MTKKILLTSVLSVITIIGVAHSDTVITSKGYVDTQIDTTQAQIPAANLNNSTIGSTVVTYTGTAGTLGERGIYSDASNYTAATDEDKLITASALTGAFNALPTTTTTKLVCANPGTCNLWSIVDQTAYGNSNSGGGGGGDSAAILEMLTALAGTDGDDGCYKPLHGSGEYMGTCTTAPSNYGDWGTMFTYNNEPVQISGISACSSVNEGLSMGGIPTNQSGVQADYETSGSGAVANTNPPGGNCYCKMTDPNTSAARWVFGYSGDASGCAVDCAVGCALVVRDVSDDFRAAVFGVPAN